jgi:hypothetical protein
MERGVHYDCEMPMVQYEEAKVKQHLSIPLIVLGRRDSSLNVAALQRGNPIIGHTWCGSSWSDSRTFEFDNLRSLGKEVPRVEEDHPLFGTVKPLPTGIFRENIQQVLVQLRR